MVCYRGRVSRLEPLGRLNGQPGDAVLLWANDWQRLRNCPCTPEDYDF